MVGFAFQLRDLQSTDLQQGFVGYSNTRLDFAVFQR